MRSVFVCMCVRWRERERGVERFLREKMLVHEWKEFGERKILRSKFPLFCMFCLFQAVNICLFRDVTRVMHHGCVCEHVCFLAVFHGIVYFYFCSFPLSLSSSCTSYNRRWKIMIMLHNHRWNNDHVTDPLVLLTGVIYFLDLFKLLQTLEWHWINFHSFSPVVDFNQFVFDFFSLFFCNNLTDLNKLHC